MGKRGDAWVLTPLGRLGDALHAELLDYLTRTAALPEDHPARVNAVVLNGSGELEFGMVHSMETDIHDEPTGGEGEAKG